MPLENMAEQERLEHAIAALEAQRALLGDVVVDAGLAAIKEKLARLTADRQRSDVPPTAETSPDAAPVPFAARRKQVTVLFADISGFTSMSASADAEDVTEAVNTLWGTVDRVIVEHGGRIDKHMGDAVMALWGAETAREDDPEQAIRAALAVQEAVRGLVLDIAGHSVNVRVGVHTGPVFLGEIGLTGEYTAMGDTVNTASRLQHAAPVGGILISYDTYQQVRGVFDVTVPGAIQVEGKTESLQVYVVERAKPRAFRLSARGVEGIETRMIGREAELRSLQDALDRAMRGRQRQLVTVIGEAGIGKSRLLYEFEHWLELLPETIRYFKGRASPESRSLPYALIRDLVAFRFCIQENDRPEAAREKIENGIGEVLSADPDAQMHAHLIGQLLGFDFSASPHLHGVADARQLRDRALIYLVEFFRATAERWPTAIFLEDIHWADGSSLAAIDALAQAIPDQPLLIICLARPTLFEHQPHWGEGLSFYTRLDLSPLSREGSRQLVAEILRKAGEVPVALRELVVSGAEGNPYYVEELIKMLIEDGVIAKGEDRWTIVPDRLVRVRVPATLAGVLQARLDSLSPLERATLQQASVLGRIFWDSAVTYLGKGARADGEDLPGTLQTLCDREMVFRRQSSAFSGAHEYIFKHTILRDVTYETVLKRERRRYHARAAEWLIEQTGERAGEFTGVIADHLELAGQSEQAARYLSWAGQRAAQQFANAEAIQYLSRALDLLPPGQAAPHYEVLLARERVYDLQGLREAQTQDLAALKALAETIVDDPQGAAARQAEVALRWSNYAEVTGDYPLGVSSALAAVEQARLAQDIAKEAEGYLLWGRALWRQENLAEAVTRNEQALALAQAHGLKRVEAQALRTLGAIAFHQGDYARVQAPYERALLLYREIGDRRGTGSCLNNLGDIARQQGEYERARDYFEQSIRTSREIGERWSEAVALGNMALVAHNLGDQEVARTHALEALSLSRAIGSRSQEAAACTNLAHALAAMGELAEAARWYQEAATLRQNLGQVAVMLESQAGLARVCLAQGDLSQALAHVESILAQLEQATLEGSEEPFRVYLTCCQVLAACQDPRASQVLDTAYYLLQQQASRISDEARWRSFLENVHAHSEIVRAWQESHRVR